MEYDVKVITEIVKKVIDDCQTEEELVPVGVSNRHIHLSFYTFTLSKNQRFLIAKKER